MSRLDREARRAQLLARGLALFGGRSYEEVSIDDIARDAGVSKGLLYHYFGSKRAFYTAVVRHAAERLVEAITPPPALEGAARGMAGLQAYLDFVEDRADAYIAVVHGGLGADGEIRAILEQTRSRIVGFVLEGIGVQERPAFRMAARAWLGAVESASLDWLIHRDLPRAELLQVLLASLFAHVAAAAVIDPDAGVELDAAQGLSLLGLSRMDAGYR